MAACRFYNRVSRSLQLLFLRRFTDQGIMFSDFFASLFESVLNGLQNFRNWCINSCKTIARLGCFFFPLYFVFPKILVLQTSVSEMSSASQIIHAVCCLRPARFIATIYERFAARFCNRHLADFSRLHERFLVTC